MASLVLPTPPTIPQELNRDIYGFCVRPHHLQLYKQFAEIYREEEIERSSRWEEFLSAHGKSLENVCKDYGSSHHLSEGAKNHNGEKEGIEGPRKFETWCNIRTSLQPIETALRHFPEKSSWNQTATPSIASTEPSSNTGVSQGSEDDSDEEFYDADRLDIPQDELQNLSDNTSSVVVQSEENSLAWKEELYALVRSGVPMALRGEVWQAFVGSGSRRVHGHYQALMTVNRDDWNNDRHGLCNPNDVIVDQIFGTSIPKKWVKQIEKDIPRTFPGHPALDVNGRKALLNVLIAYARHNPNVGYCQAMNFFAGLLLLMMPEENAFWTLVSILDDYFEGYYTEKMVEFQVDQLVLEELVHHHFPRLSSHLDALGLQVAWITGPWFLSIFINILPWESVLRVWDVLLYEQNRSMLFRTALAIFELHGSAVLIAKDAADAVTLLQSLVSATFDSSQLVLTACVGYQSLKDSHLQELRTKYYPQVLAMLPKASKQQKPFGSFTSSMKIMECDHPVDVEHQGKYDDELINNNQAYLSHDIAADEVLDTPIMLSDLLCQVQDMKLELSRTLEKRRMANMRAEELEAAFMEVVKMDNRRLLSAKVETLEAEAADLRRNVTEKDEQNQAMKQVMLRMEEELKVTQEARMVAEEDAAKQRTAVDELQFKFDRIMNSIKELESRAVKAESLLEASYPQHAPKNGTTGTKQPSYSTGEESSRWIWSWSTSK
ncbi:hypothetical protein KP509_22G021200 [Ceratopteris richardii]|uniref:Rab-GAP TBC domain-containing protein n=1 Tax=Ceratopteris richardii TaxID=49495 RepID=A0A8T2S585_CERRI|nr:hypothetical protein KP509_22G021200 [Ceratopteris richardii]KAH7306597.1 hypothetical protein KP509_22G021200 [Ceratopteris richardii]